MIFAHNRQQPWHKLNSWEFHSTHLIERQEWREITSLPQTRRKRRPFNIRKDVKLPNTARPNTTYDILSLRREHILTRASKKTWNYHIPLRGARSIIAYDIANGTHAKNWGPVKTKNFDGNSWNDAKHSDCFRLSECFSVTAYQNHWNVRIDIKLPSFFTERTRDYRIGTVSAASSTMFETMVCNGNRQQRNDRKRRYTTRTMLR